MEYSIIDGRGTLLVDFVRAVNRAIVDGWTPQGGVFCVVENGIVTGHIQAMIRMEQSVQPVDISGWEDMTLYPSLLKVDT